MTKRFVVVLFAFNSVCVFATVIRFAIFPFVHFHILMILSEGLSTRKIIRLHPTMMTDYKNNIPYWKYVIFK
jgi:hypothetical protein